MTTLCDNCDNHVSRDFARVCGSNDDQVYRCPNCAPNRGVGHLAAGIDSKL